MVRVLKPNGKLAGSTYVRGERFLTDVVMGRIGAALGYVSRPVYTEDELLAALESRGINKIVTRKVKSVMFFSGRKCAGLEVPATPAEIEQPATPEHV
jgi:nitrogen fixation protein FixH